MNTQIALSTAEGWFCGCLEVSMPTWGPLGRKVGRSERDCGFDPEARWLLWGEMPPLRSRILAVCPLSPTSPRVDGREHPQNTRIQESKGVSAQAFVALVPECSVRPGALR